MISTVLCWFTSKPIKDVVVFIGVLLSHADTDLDCANAVELCGQNISYCVGREGERERERGERGGGREGHAGKRAVNQFFT